MRVICEGNATRHAEIRVYEESGKPVSVAYFTVAVNFNVIGSDGNERHTEFITVKVKGWRVEAVCEQIDKGTRVLIEGIQTYKFNNKFNTSEPIILASHVAIVSREASGVSRETSAYITDEEVPF